MKKNILLFAFILSSGIASAQFTIWEDDFNDGEVSDWTLLDVDGNASNWLARKNLQYSGGQYSSGTYDILGSYHINTTTGATLSGTENNWAITPLIDLSYYAAPITLTINFQTSVYGGDRNLYVYLSDSPDQASFLENTPQAILFDRTNNTATQFADFDVDLSAYAGQSEVYIALVTTTLTTGMEVDKVTVTALTLGVDDVAGKTATIIKQNPVAETLQLQLGSMVNTATLSLQIYNLSGMLVKEAKYNEAGISVSDLAGGMYFVVFNDGYATERLKFIKK